MKYFFRGLGFLILVIVTTIRWLLIMLWDLKPVSWKKEWIALNKDWNNGSDASDSFSSN